MKISIPYLVAKEGAKGVLWYWIPGPRLKAQGWSTLSYAKPVEMADGSFRLLETVEEICAHARQRSEAARTGAMAAATGPAPTHSLGGWMDGFRKSREFQKLAPATQRYYQQGFAVIRDLPIPDRRGTKKPLSFWHPSSIDKAAAKELIEAVQDVRGLATARQVYAAMRRLYAWAPTARMCAGDAVNPFAGLRIETLDARQAYWQEAEVTALIALCDQGWEDEQAQPGLGDAIALAYYLGQRQGDVIRITPAQRVPTVFQQEDGRSVTKDAIQIRQRKVSKPVAVRLHEDLAARLDRIADRPPHAPYAMTADGTPFREDHLRHLFAKFRDRLAKDAPEVLDKQFRDFRRSAVVRLGELGMTALQIAAVTGHDFKSVEQILEVYCVRTVVMTDSAMTKWEGQKTLRSE